MRVPKDAPQLKPGYVYATRKGKRFHPTWCIAINGIWKQHPQALYMTNEMGARTLCPYCDAKGLPVMPTPEQAVAKNANWTTPAQQAMLLEAYRKRPEPK